MKEFAIIIIEVMILIAVCKYAESASRTIVDNEVNAATKTLNECLEPTSMRSRMINCVIVFRQDLLIAGVNPIVADMISDSVISQLFGESKI